MKDAIYGECTMGHLIVRATKRGAECVAFVTEDKEALRAACGTLVRSLVSSSSSTSVCEGESA
jgi:hypothetical protein